MAVVMDGKEVANFLKQETAKECEDLKKIGIIPGLAVIIVGSNPGSRVYVNNKKKDCEIVGIRSIEYAFNDDVTQDILIDLIKKLSNDTEIDGILVQLPLPSHISEQAIIEAIPSQMDVDAFHPINVGKIMIGDYDFLPCTPAGIMEILHYYDIDPKGKECVVVGRSNIVGKPMAMLLLHENGTVTICHSKTKNLSEVTRRAEILVAAVGIPNFIKDDMVREGAIVIDVGMNRLESGKLCGDVDYESVSKKASHITPVPGGVGLTTRAILLKNTIKAAKIKRMIT